MNFFGTMDDTTQGNRSRQLTNTDNFQRFIVIEARDDRDLSKLSPFVIDKFLKANIGTLDDLKRLRGGQLLIKTVSLTATNSLDSLILPEFR